ncbi:MAG: hypothetical protein JWO13_2720 [Acidobacteriales bacterium]|nr:hypothetical protein [Terriglobales bacterium]
MNCEPLIDAAAAAKIIGVSRRQVTNMAVASQIPAMQIGRLWKFRASLLDEWIRKQIESSNSQLPPQGRPM